MIGPALPFRALARRMTLAASVMLMVSAFILGSAVSVSAERLAHRGSHEDQMACTPDVFRLCFSEIPNEPRIVACLVRSKRSLSPACRAVFNRGTRTASTRRAKSSRKYRPARSKASKYRKIRRAQR